jgi:ABC-2 type transport system ATP-binding protein
LRILMGFARANKGEAALLGMPAGSTHEIFRRVAYVPETKDGYAYARVGEMIRLTRSFYADWDAELEARLVREWELPLREWCMKLSKGTRGKLLLLLAVCRRPELLILDEPTDGLDPIAQESAMRLLVELAGRGSTIFFSTHHLNEVEQIADRVVMIRRGRCLVEGTLDEIRERHQRVRCVTENGSVRLPAGCEGWQRDGRFLTGFTSADPARLAEDLNACGVQLLEAQPATLKEIFLEEGRLEEAREEVWK